MTLVCGKQSQDDICVCHEDGRSVSIRIRLNLGNLNVPLLRAIVEATAAADAVFVSSEERVFRAEWDAVIAELRASRAVQFVRDPLGYLRRLADSEERQEPPN